MKESNPTDYFWHLAEPMLRQKGNEKASMMGFPCLRYSGEFFAMADHRSGDLIVKLPADRVKELIANGMGQTFSPAGKVFREWTLISKRDVSMWKGLMTEAREFAKQKV